MGTMEDATPLLITPDEKTSDVRRWALLSLLSPEFVANIRSCVVFGSAGGEAVIVTRDDEVYGLGSNSSSCLGAPCSSPFEPTRVESLSRRGIKEISFGLGPHLLALSSEGTVFAWGNNAFGQLGLGHTQLGQTPAMITGALTGEKVVQIACGGHHSIALTDRGEMFAWGLNSSGQLGIGSLINQESPKPVSLSGRFIRQTACGHNFTLALTESGEVYGWGYNGQGQVGSGCVANQTVPVLIHTLGKSAVITQIACGYAHSLALSDEGHLYVWGSNTCGQLSGNLMRKDVVEPVAAAKELGRLAECAAIHACNITAVSTKGGKVFMWGHVRGQSLSHPLETRFACVDDAFACFAAPPVSCRMLQFEGTRRETLLDALRLAFDDQTTADLKVKVDGKVIHAHRALLKMRCQYFRTRFGDSWKEAANDEVEIQQFPYPVFRAFLAWLYTDELRVDGEQALGLLELANCYCEEGLKSKCAALLQKAVCVENAAVLYAAAIRHDTPALEEHAFQFCVNHLSSVVLSDGFSSLDDDATKRLLRRAAKDGMLRR